MHPIITEDLRQITAAPLPWARFSGKRVLVTGAGGLIGSYIVRALLALNESVLERPVTVWAAGRDLEKLRLKVSPAGPLDNLELVSLYWNIGRIIDREAGRAGYGKQVIENLAVHLSRQYGRGFATTSLWDMRRFHRTFQILRAVSGELQDTEGLTLESDESVKENRVIIDLQRHAHVGWSHYALLLREKDLL